MDTLNDEHAAGLRTLREALDAHAGGRLDLPALARTWRGANGLLAALPPRYGEVLDELLNRLEASSAFGDESCSFSAEDLLGNLSTWLEKAEATLSR